MGSLCAFTSTSARETLLPMRASLIASPFLLCGMATIRPTMELPSPIFLVVPTDPPRSSPMNCELSVNAVAMDDDAVLDPTATAMASIVVRSHLKMLNTSQILGNPGQIVRREPSSTV